MRKCILRKVNGQFVQFDIYCTQDKNWKAKFSRLHSCDFCLYNDTESCPLRVAYNKQQVEQIQVSQLENKGF